MKHYTLRGAKDMPHLNFYLCKKEDMELLDRGFDVAIAMPYKGLPAKARRAYERIMIGDTLFPACDLDLYAKGDAAVYMYVPLRLGVTGADRTQISRRINAGTWNSRLDPRELYEGQVEHSDPDDEDARLSPLGYISSIRHGFNRPNAFTESAMLRGRAFEAPEPVCMLCPNVGERRRSPNDPGCYPGCSACQIHLARVEGRNILATLRRASVRALDFASTQGDCDE